MMTAEEFADRFTKAQPEAPPGLDIELAVFSPFPSGKVSELRVSDVDRSILLSGLPEDAAPYLSFGFDEEFQLAPLPQTDDRLGREFAKFLVLGSNGSGDLISLDATDGRVVYHNHDNEMQEVFVNSSISQLAETLCLYAEARKGGVDFMAELKVIDPSAAADGAMWPAESRAM